MRTKNISKTNSKSILTALCLHHPNLAFSYYKKQTSIDLDAADAISTNDERNVTVKPKMIFHGGR